MSVVSNIVLICHLADRTVVEKAWPIDRFPLRHIDAFSGGDKVFCNGLFAWASNYLDLDAFLFEIESIPWIHPSSVMLLVRQEGEECPAVYRLGMSEAYSHDDQIEMMLDAQCKPYKLVKVVKARSS